MSGRAILVTTTTAAVLALALVAWRVAADDAGPAAVAIDVSQADPGLPAEAQRGAGEGRSGTEGTGPGGESARSGDAGAQGVGGVAPAGAGAVADHSSAALPSSADPAAGATLALERPADAYPLVRVRRGERVEVRTEPGGGKLVELAGRRTEFHSPTVFGVIRESGRWAGVTTPDLPNNQLGWIKLDGRRLKAAWTRVSIEVDLSQRRAELRESGKPVRSFAVTIGMPGADTPTGRFAVTDTLRGGLNAAYGCCAVALSATQPNLPSGWLGGSRIAIHGTSGPLGVAASHGCVRAADVDVSELVDRVPLGAPVFIRA
jgi:hypothetical protein